MTFFSRTAIELFNNERKIRVRFTPSDVNSGFPKDCWDDFSVMDVKVTDFQTGEKYQRTTTVDKLGETSDFFEELLFHIFRDEIVTAILKFPQQNVDVSLGEVGESAFLILRFDLKRFKPVPTGGNPEQFKLHFRLFRKKDRAIRPLFRLETMAASHAFEGELFVPLNKMGKEKDDLNELQQQESLTAELAMAMEKEKKKAENEKKKIRFRFDEQDELDRSDEMEEEVEDSGLAEDEVVEENEESKTEEEKEKSEATKGAKGGKKGRARASSAENPVAGAEEGKKRKSPRQKK